MSNVKVLLLKPVKHLGGEGEVVTVKAGFARNFLLPKGWVIPSNHATDRQIASLQRARQLREAKELEEAQALAKRIEAVSLTIVVKTGSEGKLFGSVSASNILERYEEQGITFDKACLRLPHPIKTLGRHHFQVRLHKDVHLDLSVEVVSENPIA